MIFKITRTSMSSEDKPCEEAFQVVFPVYDHRVFKTFEEHDARFPNSLWLSRGTEHKVEPDGISRRMADRQGWAVNLDTLDQLMALVSKYGDCIIGNDMIEIYDDYRE